MRARRFLLTLLAVLASLGMLAACGGEDDGLAAGDVSTGDDRSVDDDAANDDDDAAAAEESDGSAGDVETFCDAIDGFDYLGALEASSPEELRERYADYEDQAQEIAEAAPAEIEADLLTSLDAGLRIKDLMEEHDYVSVEAASDAEFVEILNPEAFDAGVRLDEYVKENC